MALSVNGGFGSKGGGSNPNLLDNGWFTVNQRGATSVSSTEYGADRWVRNRGVVTFGDGYIDLSYSSSNLGAVQQFFEKDLPHGKYTGSVMLDDGTIYSGTINYTGESTNTFFTNSKIELDLFKTTKTYVTLYGVGTETVRVKAVKIERGSVSTLALDSAPNYTTELLKCQRYFYRISALSSNSLNTNNVATAYNTTLVYYGIKLPTSMRVKPSVTWSTVTLRNGSNNTSVTSISVSSPSLQNDFIEIGCSAPSLSTSTVYILRLGAGGYIDFSADL